MSRIEPAETADRPPVLHTPRGAIPRALPSDAFVNRQSVPTPAVYRSHGNREERAPDSTDAGEEPAPRDWEFALPATTRDPAVSSLIDPDVNRRQHAGLHPPIETIPLPALARERFSENWQRLANKDQSDVVPERPHRLENFRLTKWLFSHGKLELAAAAGTLLLVLLLVAAFIYGRRILSGSDQKSGPAEKPQATSC